MKGFVCVALKTEETTPESPVAEAPSPVESPEAVSPVASVEQVNEPVEQ